MTQETVQKQAFVELEKIKAQAATVVECSTLMIPLIEKYGDRIVSQSVDVAADAMNKAHLHAAREKSLANAPVPVGEEMPVAATTPEAH